MLSSQVCHLQPHSTRPYTLFIPFPMRQANTVMTILGFTSTRSSGRAYTLAPIFRAMEMAYLKERKQEKSEEPEQQSMKGTLRILVIIILYHTLLQTIYNTKLTPGMVRANH